MRTTLLVRALFAAALLAFAAGRAVAVGSDAGAISLTFIPSARGEAMGGLVVTEANDYGAPMVQSGWSGFHRQGSRRHDVQQARARSGG